MIDAVSKSSIISQVLSEKILEFGLCHWDTPKTMFILVSTLYYYFIEEQSGKWDMIGPAYPSGLKIILILLAKVVTVYMQVIIIEVRKQSFKKMFARI